MGLNGESKLVPKSSVSFSISASDILQSSWEFLKAGFLSPDIQNNYLEGL